MGKVFYNKFYFSLAALVDNSSDLNLGFTCKWTQICEAVDDALGAMARVKRLSSFLKKRDYMKGGFSFADKMKQINYFIDEYQVKTNKVFLHEDGTQGDNKVAKVQLKFNCL